MYAFSFFLCCLLILYYMMCSKCFVFLHSHSLCSCHHTIYYFSSVAQHNFQCCCFFRVLLFICLTVCYYSKFLIPSWGRSWTVSSSSFMQYSMWYKFNHYLQILLVIYFALNATHIALTILCVFLKNAVIYSKEVIIFCIDQHLHRQDSK